ncbi:MAG: hypothetical protein DWQ31_01200 [Planctomycetota bacterium]|mgnify:CR=1 FL=1|nr:MAG: hypothetical protein DWQ31_01200 [Planctomycetota bacterium]REJ90909.1 MAG: hypothetical protein DWQ35_15610 [Planctomycetota bacterium]REK17686.1 MAG: hypothetical protein DWQ42_21825 [Planctomycetota bacterium]REK46739.1 MAG: hypothetical protein DWQ46_05935 [Planctomycetota bacterium]
MKTRQLLGKYRIEKKLGEGGFAMVYRALDTIEGVRVALKIPHPQFTTREFLEAFRHEVRLAAKLKHPRILPVKNAEFINGHFVIAMPLGEQTLDDRLMYRMARAAALDYAEQTLEAVAFAHSHRVIHCDIKPENLIIFPDNTLMLTDFGIAKISHRTVAASGSGTIGYMSPEQAMGKPSFRSDVFSIGLLLYRMLTGTLPTWPFTWPPLGYDRLRGRQHPDLIQFLRRAIEVEPRKRFKDADQMYRAFQRIKPRALRYQPGASTRTSRKQGEADWRSLQRKQFLRQYGKALDTRHACRRCDGPVSEAMQYCPWCKLKRSKHEGDTRFPQHCPRCHRGLKSDWEYCPWCFGPGFHVQVTREFTDKNYSARCTNAKCKRKLLMPYMRYCPWCHRKVRRKWPIPKSTKKCRSCGWGVVEGYWTCCPWCGKKAD